MTTIYLISGILLVASVLTDLVWTTLWVEGGIAPIAGFVSRSTWKTIRKLSQSRRTFSLAGPVTLIVTIVTWILLLWIGWTLIFSSDPNAISDSYQRGTVNFANRFYYVGYLMTTLGPGDYIVHNSLWQIISAFVSFQGMLILTLGASYVLNIVDTANKMRALALEITSIASTSSELIVKNWNGEDFSQFENLLSRTTTTISTLSMNHKAYPLLYFNTTDDLDQSFPYAVSILYEALLLLRYGVKEEVVQSSNLHDTVQASLLLYINSSQFVNNIQAADEKLSTPVVSDLAEHDIPVYSQEKFDEQLAQDSEYQHKKVRLHALSGADFN